MLLGPRSSPRGATPGPLSLRPSRACTSVQPGGCAKCECTCTSVRCGGVQGVRASAVCLWNVQGEGVRGVHGGKTRAGSACSRATQGCARVRRTHARATWGWNACARAVGGVCRVCMCNEGRGAGGWGGAHPTPQEGGNGLLTAAHHSLPFGASLLFSPPRCALCPSSSQHGNSSPKTQEWHPAVKCRCPFKSCNSALSL